MTFDLTDALADEVADALENQEKRFFVNAKSRSLVDAQSVEADAQNYYELPEWNSADGFKLREEFVNALHAPLARKRLQESLHTGRGVFRNFKNALKEFPEVEKLWHRFRNRKMREYIVGWYNGLREIWGLEKLDHFYEENGDLIRGDFIFQEYDSRRDKETIVNFAARDSSGECTGIGVDADTDADERELVNALSELWKNLFEKGEELDQSGFVCRSSAGDFAGCVTAAPVSSRFEKTVVLTSFFVVEAYRGLGIGSELFSLCLADMKKRGKRYMVTANTLIPDSLVSLLERNGFQKTGSGFAARIY